MSLKTRASFVVNPLPQGGSNGDDLIRGAVALDKGSVILVGGINGTDQGSNDFAAVELDTNDGTVLWRWQVLRASVYIYILNERSKSTLSTQISILLRWRSRQCNYRCLLFPVLRGVRRCFANALITSSEMIIQFEGIRTICFYSLCQ